MNFYQELTDKQKQEISMFGETKDSVISNVPPFSKDLYIMGILSDCQESLAEDQNPNIEQVNQFLNKAKFLMGQLLEVKPDQLEG
jgi:hypothetical protein